MPAASTAPSSPVRDTAKWVGLVVLLSAAFMDLADVTIVNVALPTIDKDLHPSAAGMQWITGGYSVTFAIFMIVGGRLGDIYGRRKLFTLGIVIFTAASLLAGLAPTTTALITARVIQGVGAGMMVPQVLAIINVTFDKDQRPKAFGLYGATIGLATVLGQLIGAVLIELNIGGTDWRPIFLVNVPIGVAVLVFGLRYLPESTDAELGAGIDVLGAAGMGTALFLLLFPLTIGRQEGWPVWCWIMIATSAIVMAGVVFQQIARDRAGRDALIPARIFRRSTTGGFAVQLVFATAAGIFFLTWILYMQIGLGWSPMRAAVTGLSFALAAAVASGVAIQALAPRLGRGTLHVGAGLMLTGAALFAVLLHTTTMTSTLMLLPLLIMGFGMGCVVSPLADLVLSDVPGDESGSVSGVFNTLNQVGSALGISLTSVAFFDILDRKKPGDISAQYTAAFAQSLYWIIGLLLAVLIATFIIPARLRLTQDGVTDDADDVARQPHSADLPQLDARP